MLSDGAITFDRGVRLNTPQMYPLEGDFSSLQVVSVFLADHDPRSGGSVRYRVDRNTTEDVKTVSEFIRNQNVSTSFEGVWMLVAEWKDVPMFGNNNQVRMYTSQLHVSFVICLSVQI